MSWPETPQEQFRRLCKEERMKLKDLQEEALKLGLEADGRQRVVKFSDATGQEICSCGLASEGIDKIEGEWFCKTCGKPAWSDESKPLEIVPRPASFRPRFRTKSILGRMMCRVAGAVK